MAEGSNKVTIRLLIDTKGKKVLYAEAGKDFVDFLFHILSLPIATVVNLLTVKGKGMVGCLSHLYKSIEALGNDYIQSQVTKDSVLKPVMTCNSAVKVPLLLSNDSSKNTPSDKKLYRCTYSGYNNCRDYYSDSYAVACDRCHQAMTSEMVYVPPKNTTGSGSTSSTVAATDSGYVKGVVTYMVMDNLVVKPMSTISGITLLNQFNVKDVGSLVDKEVQIGLTEGVFLLKASLQTTAVLTSIFM